MCDWRIVDHNSAVTYPAEESNTRIQMYTEPSPSLRKHACSWSLNDAEAALIDDMHIDAKCVSAHACGREALFRFYLVCRVLVYEKSMVLVKLDSQP